MDSGNGGFIFDAELGDRSVVSNSDWRVRQHPSYLHSTEGPQPSRILAEHNILFDSRRDVLGDWEQVGYDDSHWPVAVAKGEPPVEPWGALVERSVPMWRFSEIRDFVSQKTETAEDGTSVIMARLPYNAQVTAVLEVDAEAGLTIDIRTDNYQVDSRYSVRTEYVTRSGSQSFESLGWFNGDEVHFTVEDGVIIRRLGYRESGYDADFEGNFTSDDPFLDRLWHKAARTTYVNMRDSFMDCPDRERAQWWGDIVNEMPQAFYSLDPRSHALASKAVHDLVNWRKDGVVLHSPIPAGNVEWELPLQMLASVGRFGFWQYFMHTGDDGTINDIHEPVLAYLGLWEEKAGGLVVHRAGDWDWTDWGSNTDTPVVENAWFALALQGAIEMAHAVGDIDTANDLEMRLNRLGSSFNQEFWTGSNYKSPTHLGPPDDRANALAIVAGLASEAKWPILRSVLSVEKHASPFMERFVLEALFRMGFPEDGLARMRERFTPMVDDSTSTLWEFWDKDLGSDNHGWTGGPLYLLSAYVAGIAPESPGWVRFHVMPQLAHLHNVSCTVPTVRGPVEVAHLRLDTEHRTDLISPLGTTALVGIPVHSRDSCPVTVISVNGSVVWEEGTNTSIPGVNYAGSVAGFLTFEVIPGEWSFRGRSNACGLFSDGFERGDTTHWR